MNRQAELDDRLAPMRLPLLLAAVLGGLACLAGAFLAPTQFHTAYLVAYLYGSAIPLGSLAVLMIYRLTGGAWGWAIQRLLEAGVRTMPLTAILFLPLLPGLGLLYPWVGAGHDALAPAKALYLSLPFFLARAGIYFAVWLGCSVYLLRWSAQVDRGNQEAAGRLQLLSALGLLAYGLTATFAAVDWLMSLEPEWYSTSFGLICIAGQVLAGLALAVGMAAWLLPRELDAGQFNDLGNLLLAFAMLWAYLSFFQFLIIWSGNLPAEISWYLRRTAGGWEWPALMLLVCQFALPFLLLLFRTVKRQPRHLAIVAALLLLAHLLELFWYVAPAASPAAFRLHWLDVAAVLAVGGIWGSAYLQQLGQYSLLPAAAPPRHEGYEHG